MWYLVWFVNLSPQIFVEQFRYKEKEVVNFIPEDIESFSDDDDDDDDGDDDDGGSIEKGPKKNLNTL